MFKKIFPILFIFVASLFYFSYVDAADIYVSSDKSIVTENQTFTVSAYVDTKSVAINNTEGILRFPSDLLSVDSVSINGSIFSIWVEQPSFSNTQGTITFNGGVPTPGYSGAKGKVITINFRAKKSGIAQISFASATVYANDGLGTDITKQRSGTSVTIGEKTIETPVVPEATDTVPGAPVLYSTDVPDPEAWYSIDKATLSWTIPAKVTAVQLAFDSSPNGTPNVLYSTPINKKEISTLTDGTHYIHVRFKNAVGWGKIAHRKINIDTLAPTGLSVVTTTTKDDLISLSTTSKDATSGVANYKVSIDGVFSTEVVVKNDVTDIILPPQKKGNHTITVYAYDKAGNVSEKSFVIEFPEIQVPEITSYPESIQKGQAITIKGTSYPSSDVRIWIKTESNEAKSYTVKTLEDSSFSFTSDFINKSGLTSFWVESARSDISVSSSSEKYFVVVKKSEFVKLSLATIEILSVAIPIILLAFFLIYMFFHVVYRLRKLRKRLKIDLEDAETETHKIFSIISEDMKDVMKIFKNKEIKSKLSTDDTELITTFSKDIKEAEKYLAERIKTIEKKDL